MTVNVKGYTMEEARKIEHAMLGPDEILRFTRGDLKKMCLPGHHDFGTTSLCKRCLAHRDPP